MRDIGDEIGHEGLPDGRTIMVLILWFMLSTATDATENYKDAA
jgi:hypothetical protein